MRRERRTQEYFARSPLAKPGKSKLEIIRCLKRYVPRGANRVLISCGTRPLPTGT